jgi:hypothetical protein
MYMDGARNILGTAQDVALAREQMGYLKETIHGTPDLDLEWEGESRRTGDEWFRASGCRYIIKALNRRAGRGGSNDEVNIDELREQYDWDAWAAVSKTTMARANAQIWCMSNAGDSRSVVLNQLQDRASSGREDDICILEWSAPDGCELTDTDGWRQANPALGYTITEAAIRSALGEPPGIFRTEVLCQRVDKVETAVDLAAWKACADPAGTMEDPELRKRVAACFDVALDGGHCTLAVAAVLNDGRVRTGIAGAWPSTDAARLELVPLLDKIRPAAVAWYPAGPAGALAPMLRQRPGSTELTGGKVAEACQGLADLAKARQIAHSGDPLLDAHINAAQKLRSGDGWRFTRHGGGDVDAAYACAGAVSTALTMPVPARARIRILA